MKACIFDLDGVLVDTAKYHYIAWKRLADSLGVQFNEHDNEQLKGLSRDASLQYILQKGNVKIDSNDFQKHTEQKNHWYLELVASMSNDESLPNAKNLLEDLRANQIKIALGSASKNAKLILDRVEMTHLFDVIVDGTRTSKSKPDPEVFLFGAHAMGVQPSECVVFEDALMGVKAAKDGGFHCVGVGEPEILQLADEVVADLTAINYEWLKEKF